MAVPVDGQSHAYRRLGVRISSEHFPSSALMPASSVGDRSPNPKNYATPRSIRNARTCRSSRSYSPGAGAVVNQQQAASKSYFVHFKLGGFFDTVIYEVCPDREQPAAEFLRHPALHRHDGDDARL